MDDLVKRLVTEEGFIEAYYEEVQRRYRSGEPALQKDVFDYLNNLYEAEIGQPRYPSFDAFRMARNRRHKMSHK